MLQYDFERIEMGKVALVSDLHFGVKDSDRKFQDSQFAFMEQMVQNCKDRDIEKIFVLGDLFDTRHAVNVLTVNRVVEFFKSHEGEVIWYIILGNHDLYYKNSIDVSSMVVLDRINNVNIIDKPQRMRLDNKKCSETGKDHDTVVVPWVTDYEEMAKKTVFRAVFKWLPISIEETIAVNRADERSVSYNMEKANSVPEADESIEVNFVPATPIEDEVIENVQM
jgi:hypothetical protein